MTHNFLGEIVEVFFSIHELLKIDHRVEVTYDEKLVLTTSYVDIDLVHGDVLGVAAVSVFLHFRVILLHLIWSDVKRKRSTFLNVIQEIPSSGCVGIFFLTKALYFGSLKHVVQLVIVEILGALVVIHFKHTREGTVCVKNLASSNQS